MAFKLNISQPPQNLFSSTNQVMAPLSDIPLSSNNQIVAPIGIFFGRIANFINSELYGLEANIPWAVKFIKVDDIYRHPSQLYEALFEGIILFFIVVNKFTP